MPNPQSGGIRFVKVTLVQSVGQDALGQPSQSPVTYIDCWAQVVSLKGAELTAAAQVNATINTKITVRYSDVKAAFEDGSLAKMYVLYRATYYDIQGLISRDQKDQWLDLLCVARIGQPAIFA